MTRCGDRQAVFVRIPLNPHPESKGVHVVYSRGYGKLTPQRQRLVLSGKLKASVSV